MTSLGLHVWAEGFPGVRGEGPPGGGGKPPRVRFLRDEGELSKTRFEAFSDGVFAIAITLLVLDIHVPDLRQADDAHMRAALAGLGPPLLTYALSFATVGVIWLNHHAAFMHVRTVDRTTNLLNVVLLAVVCFVPFPTALLSRYGALPSSVTLYGATFTAMSIAYGANWIYAAWRTSALDPAAPRVTPALVLTGAIGTVFYVLGTAIAPLAPKVSIGIFVAVTIYYMLPGLFTPRAERRTRRPPSATTSG